MSVRERLERAIEAGVSDADEARDLRRWLARTEVFLDWIAKHPRLVEINCEAAHLLSAYRAESLDPIKVDYRGVGPRPKRGAEAS